MARFQHKDCNLRLITDKGRKTPNREPNYTLTKGEMSAVIYALHTYKHILCYNPFVIMTDHQSTKWIQPLKNPQGIMAQWLMELQSYNFTVHVPGK